MSARAGGGRLAAAGLVVVLAVGACAGAAGSPSASATASAAAANGSPAATTPSGAPGSTIGADRRSDLAFLLERLVAIHPEPFLEEGEAGFRARLDALGERADDLSEAGFLVGVMDLMGHRDRDGHSGAWAMAQRGDRLHAWPIWLWEFSDGMRIVAAQDQTLVGARVTAVGGTPLEEAMAAVEPLVPRDNPTTLRGNLPIYLTLPEVLRERGVWRDGAAGLTLELADNSTLETTPDDVPIQTFQAWIFDVYLGDYPSGLPPDPDGPAWARNRDQIIWTEPLAEGGLYVGYNHILRPAHGDTTTVSSVAKDVSDAMDAGATDPVIVDLRNNPGGDNNTYGLFRSALERYADAAPRTVALIAGRSTFSAAGNFVTDLERGHAADEIILVGNHPVVARTSTAMSTW